jgi:MarR family transcriptional regulator for hemolysin
MYLDRRLSVLGLSNARCLALVEISKAETVLSQRELAGRLGIESATLVNLLDGLAARNLIRRVPDAKDRRTKRLEITPAGEEVVHSIAEIAESVRTELLVDVSEGELRSAIGVVKRIQARLDDAMTS